MQVLSKCGVPDKTESIPIKTTLIKNAKVLLLLSLTLPVFPGLFVKITLNLWRQNRGDSRKKYRPLCQIS